MSIDYFDTAYLNHLGPSDFIVTVGNFADSLLAHPFFRDNWVDFVTHPMQLKDLLVVYKDAVTAVETDGGKKNMKIRDDARAEAYTSVVLMTQFLVMMAKHKKDFSLLDAVILKQKTKANRNTHPTTLAAPHPAVKHGKEPGTVIIVYNRIPGAGSTEIQMCLGDPNAEDATWQTVGIYKYLRVPIPGLQRGTTVYFRLRCHGIGEPGPWSDVISIIV